MTVPSKSNVPSLWPWPSTYEGQLFFSELSTTLLVFCINFSVISLLIAKKYNTKILAGHTDRHTHHAHRQTGWKQYLATPSGGEVIISRWRRRPGDGRYCNAPRPSVCPSVTFSFLTVTQKCIAVFSRNFAGTCTKSWGCAV